MYEYKGYKLLQELVDLCPDIEHIGVQVIMGTKDNPTDIKNIVLDVEDVNKVHCKGVKFASVRGWWKDKTEIYSGISYDSKIIKNILNRLPHNSIVYLHTQGSNTGPHNQEIANILKLTTSYPWLKFILFLSKKTLLSLAAGMNCSF